MDQDIARAYCDAGYMQLDEYLRLAQANGWTPQAGAIAPARFTAIGTKAHNAALEKAIVRLKALVWAAIWSRKKSAMQPYRDVA